MKDNYELHELISFRLGRLGYSVTSLYADRLKFLGITPKHVGVLATLHTKGVITQQELALELGVAPSLIVLLADDLEAMHAITRLRDATDRRRQNLRLEPAGLELLEKAVKRAREIDDELGANLTSGQKQLLRELLMAIEIHPKEES